MVELLVDAPQGEQGLFVTLLGLEVVIVVRVTQLLQFALAGIILIQLIF